MASIFELAKQNNSKADIVKDYREDTDKQEVLILPDQEV